MVCDGSGGPIWTSCWEARRDSTITKKASQLIGALILGDRFWVVRGGRPAGVAASRRGPKRVRSAWGTCRAATQRPRPLDQPRNRPPSTRPAESSRTDRVGRRRGVWKITTADQSADQTGSAGPGSWTTSRSVTYRSSRNPGGGAFGGARGGSSASPQYVRIYDDLSRWESRGIAESYERERYRSMRASKRTSLRPPE